jgi:hypothetical protein
MGQLLHGLVLAVPSQPGGPPDKPGHGSRDNFLDSNLHKQKLVIGPRIW